MKIEELILAFYHYNSRKKCTVVNVFIRATNKIISSIKAAVRSVRLEHEHRSQVFFATGQLLDQLCSAESYTRCPPSVVEARTILVLVSDKLFIESDPRRSSRQD